VHTGSIKKIATNKKAWHNYAIGTEYEAGISLVGTEVKSLRNGKANLKESYCRIKNSEVYVHQMHIGSYDHAYYGNHEPMRKRKLLLHRAEIKRIEIKMNERGFLLIPLSIYFKNGKVKLKIALARGKKLYDKRDSLKNKDAQRELDRVNKYKDY